jgi:hypothetical protein
MRNMGRSPPREPIELQNTFVVSSYQPKPKMTPIHERVATFGSAPADPVERLAQQDFELRRNTLLEKYSSIMAKNGVATSFTSRPQQFEPVQ